jgi:hypothetical protein
MLNYFKFAIKKYLKKFIIHKINKRVNLFNKKVHTKKFVKVLLFFISEKILKSHNSEKTTNYLNLYNKKHLTTNLLAQKFFKPCSIIIWRKNCFLMQGSAKIAFRFNWNVFLFWLKIKKIISKKFHIKYVT